MVRLFIAIKPVNEYGHSQKINSRDFEDVFKYISRLNTELFQFTLSQLSSHWLWKRDVYVRVEAY